MLECQALFLPVFALVTYEIVIHGSFKCRYSGTNHTTQLQNKQDIFKVIPLLSTRNKLEQSLTLLIKCPLNYCL